MFSIKFNDKYIFKLNLMVVSRLDMYVHSVTMCNEKYLCVTEYIYVKLGHLYVMSTVSISIVGQIQGTQNNTL